MSSIRKAKNRRSAITPSPQKALSLQMLDRLRSYQRTSDPEIDLAYSLPRTVLLPADKAAYAVALSHCLALHFDSVKNLLASKAFIVIRCRQTDLPSTVAVMLYEVAACEGITVAMNPQRHLRNSDRLVIVTDLSAISGESARAVPEAARRGLPVISVVSPFDVLPDALKGPDLSIEIPPINNQMLQMILTACLGENKTDALEAFKRSSELTVGDLVGHVRPGRPLERCLEGLQAAIVSRDLPKISSLGTVTLEDLAGYGEARTWGIELSEDFALWRQNQLSWEEFEHRAVVLAGPPGTGKTSFAGVLAGTLKVPLIASSVAEWNGHDNLSGTLRRMRAVFDEAVAKAPCVLLIDELDGISSREAIAGRYEQYWTQIVNLMLEMVTRAVATPGVIIVGATNHVERIDPALTRSGRLDRVIRIELPDPQAIAAILTRYVGPTVPANELNAIANRLAGRSGADIERLVRTAKATARRAGHTFSASDLLESMPDPFDALPVRTQRRIAIYRAGQFVVGQLLSFIGMDKKMAKGNLRDLAVDAVRDGFYTEQVCNDMLAMIMAGRAAEELVFGDVSMFGSGSDDSDLALATRLARDLEMTSGFGENGLVYLDDPGLASVVPATTIRSIRRRIDAAKCRASALLMGNRDELEAVAARLVPRGATDEEQPDLKIMH